MREKWEWCAYRVTTEGGEPRYRAGWGWRLWGINSRPRRGPFRITHLPTGLLMPGEFPRQRDARRFCETIDPLVDWEEVTPENVTELVSMPVMMHALRNAGFNVRPALEVVEGNSTVH